MWKPPQSPPMETLLARHGARLGSAWGDPEYAAVVERCRARYRHWGKVRLLAAGAGVDPELVWLLLKAERSAARRNTPFRGVGGGQVWYTMPDALQREAMLVDRNLAGWLGTDDGAAVGRRGLERFVVNSLMEEAIASSQVEGASTTRRLAKDMLRSGRAPRTRDERMIANNYRAILMMRERRAEPLSAGFLLEIQATLTDGTLDRADEVGRFRRADEQVDVTSAEGEILHEPPPAGEIPARVRALCDFANEPDGAREFTHPLVRAMLLHFQLAYDHPFCDGNGRTARALFYWSMLRAGYWMFEFLPISRLILRAPARYGRSFLEAETDGLDATYFLVEQSRAVRLARQEFSAYVERTREEARRAESLLALGDGLTARQRGALHRMLARPDRAMTIAEHQREAFVSYATARSDLLLLASKGYIAQRRAGKAFEFVLGPRAPR